MKKVISSFIAGGLLVLGILLATSIRADDWNKITVVTFSEPVQVPGMVLPAGTYVFKLMYTESDQNIVQILNADETHLFTTILAIRDYRANPSDKTILTFDERPVGQPEALESWFYPGDNYGQEFVYPNQKATELAQVNKRPVPSIPDEVREPEAIAPSAPSHEAYLRSATVTRVAATPPAASPAPPAPVTETSTVTAVAIEKLPQTASSSRKSRLSGSLPLIVLVGTLCLMGAFLLSSICGAEYLASQKREAGADSMSCQPQTCYFDEAQRTEPSSSEKAPLS